MRTALHAAARPAKPNQLELAVVLTPAGPSPPVLRKIRRFAASICRHRAPRRLPAGGRPGQHGRRRAAVGRAWSFQSENTVTVPFVAKARSVETGGSRRLFFPIELSRPPDSDGLGRLRMDSAKHITVYRDTATQEEY